MKSSLITPKSSLIAPQTFMGMLNRKSFEAWAKEKSNDYKPLKSWSYDINKNEYCKPVITDVVLNYEFKVEDIIMAKNVFDTLKCDFEVFCTYEPNWCVLIQKNIAMLDNDLVIVVSHMVKK